MGDALQKRPVPPSLSVREVSGHVVKRGPVEVASARRSLPARLGGILVPNGIVAPHLPHSPVPRLLAKVGLIAGGMTLTAAALTGVVLGVVALISAYFWLLVIGGAAAFAVPKFLADRAAFTAHDCSGNCPTCGR